MKLSDWKYCNEELGFFEPSTMGKTHMTYVLGYWLEGGDALHLYLGSHRCHGRGWRTYKGSGAHVSAWVDRYKEDERARMERHIVSFHESEQEAYNTERDLQIKCDVLNPANDWRNLVIGQPGQKGGVIKGEELNRFMSTIQRKVKRTAKNTWSHHGVLFHCKEGLIFFANNKTACVMTGLSHSHIANCCSGRRKYANPNVLGIYRITSAEANMFPEIHVYNRIF